MSELTRCHEYSQSELWGVLTTVSGPYKSSCLGNISSLIRLKAYSSRGQPCLVLETMDLGGEPLLSPYLAGIVSKYLPLYPQKMWPSPFIKGTSLCKCNRQRPLQKTTRDQNAETKERCGETPTATSTTQLLQLRHKEHHRREMAWSFKYQKDRKFL